MRGKGEKSFVMLVACCAALLLFVFFAVAHVGHHCPGTACAVCGQIQRLADAMKLMGAGACAVALWGVSGNDVFSRTELAGFCARLKKTPVETKIRLNI